MQRKQNKAGRKGDLAIFGRLIEAKRGNLEPRLARYLLTLGFSKRDQQRINELAAGNQSGQLTNVEAEELQSYVRSGHLLALLHSKARKSLKRAS